MLGVPRFALRRRLLEVAVGALVVGSLAPSVLAAEPERLAWADPEAESLTFSGGDGQFRASVTKVLVNESGSGEPIQLSVLPTAALPVSAGISIEPATVSVPAGGAATIQMTVVVSGDLEPDKLTGSIVAASTATAGRVVAPAVLQFSTADTSTSVADAVLVPGAVTITANRCWPGFIPGAQDCWVYVVGPPSASVELAEPVSSTGLPVWQRLYSDTGQTVEVAVQGPTDAGEQVDQLEVRLGEASGNGKFTGDIALAPSADESASLSATIRVQDFVLWPLLTIILGAWAAYLIVHRQDRHRPAELLRARIKTIHEANKSKLGQTCAFPLTALPAETSWPDDPPDTATRAERLYARIGAARAREELDDIGKEVADIDVAVQEWRKVCERAGKLQGLITDYTRPLTDPDRPKGAPLPADAPMLDASRVLLARGDKVDAGSAATALATEVGDQIIAFREWVESWILVSASGEVYDQVAGKELTTAERLLLRQHHPDNLLHGFLWPARDLKHMRDLRVLERARETYGLLRGLAASYGGIGTMAVSDAIDAATTGAPTAGAADDLRVATDERPAKVILTQVAEADVRQYVFTTTVAIVAYLVTIYADKDFGSIWHYLTALGAGVAGVLVVKWDLLPWFRSFKPAAPKA